MSMDSEIRYGALAHDQSKAEANLAAAVEERRTSAGRLSLFAVGRDVAEALSRWAVDSVGEHAFSVVFPEGTVLVELSWAEAE